MREEYEAWFIGKFGFPPMPIHSRVLDFCWAGYQAGVESMRQQLAEALLWKEAVEHELIVAGIWNKSHENDPKKAVKEAIDWYVQVARDMKEYGEEELMIELCRRSTK